MENIYQALYELAGWGVLFGIAAFFSISNKGS